MATFGDLVTQASSRLQDANNTAVSQSVVGDAINSAIGYWKQRRFWFNETSDVVTLIVDDPLLPTPSVDFLYFFPRYGVRIPYQNNVYDMVKVSPEVYDSSNIQTQGRPYQYTWRDGSYLLYFYPDQTYTVVLTGVKNYAAMSNPTDSNDFTEDADQLILYDALSRLISELRTDPDMTEYYLKRRDDEYKNLIMRTNKMTGTGRAQSDSGIYRPMNYYYTT